MILGIKPYSLSAILQGTGRKGQMAMRRLKLVNVRQLAAVSLLLSLLICEAVGITQELVYPPNAPKILSDYGDWSGVRGGRRDQEHAGIDFAGRVGNNPYAGAGSPVLATADGKVLTARWNDQRGFIVTIAHGRNADGNYLWTLYFHNQKNLVEIGQEVKRGQRIATVGSTGWGAAGVSHVHLYLYKGADARFTPQQNGQFPENPHEYWVDGPYKPTCFDPAREYPKDRIRLTLPVECAPLESKEKKQ
jgi:murein DD-endopeptidase MepM/ murein hydrolase activator NlpD